MIRQYDKITIQRFIDSNCLLEAMSVNYFPILLQVSHEKPIVGVLKHKVFNDTQLLKMFGIR